MKNVSAKGTVPILDIEWNSAKADLPPDQFPTRLTSSRSICEFIEKSFGRLGVCTNEDDNSMVDVGLLDDWISLLQDWDGNAYSFLYQSPEVTKITTLVSKVQIELIKDQLQDSSKLSPDLVKAFQEKLADKQKGYSEQDKSNSSIELQAILDRANKQLEKTAYLAGSRYSFADTLFTTILWRISQGGQYKRELVETSGRERVHQYFNEKIKTRPSYEKCFNGFYVQKWPALSLVGSIFRISYYSLRGRL